jgi:hypothetical protein
LRRPTGRRTRNPAPANVAIHAARVRGGTSPNAASSHHGHDRKQDERVLAVEHERPRQHGGRRQPRPSAPRLELPQQRENRRRQEEIERRLLDQSVEEDRRRVDRQHRGRDDARARVEEAPPGEGQQHA